MAYKSQISVGVPFFTYSKEQVNAVLSSIWFALGTHKILINVASADLVKEGSDFDLMIACSIHISMNIFSELEIADI